MRHDVSLIAFAVWLMLAMPASALDSTITYQGQLQENSEPFTGTANLQFQLYGVGTSDPQTPLQVVGSATFGMETNVASGRNLGAQGSYPKYGSEYRTQR